MVTKLVKAKPEDASDANVRSLYLLVIGILGALAALSLVGAIILACLGREIPQLIVALASVAVGSIAGLLAPSPVK